MSSPANVSPPIPGDLDYLEADLAGNARPAPAPAPGQRWRLQCGCVVDLGPHPSVAHPGARHLVQSVGSCGEDDTSGHWGWSATTAFAEYLGPTPSPATPAAPAATPTVGAAGPPDGYVPCRGGCGRYMAESLIEQALSVRCWGCWPTEPTHKAWIDAKRKYPDWTPPAAVPVAPLADSRMVAPVPKPYATIAELQRIRAHALAEGGDSATREAPGRTRDTFEDLRDDFDNLPDVDVRR